MLETSPIKLICLGFCAPCALRFISLTNLFSASLDEVSELFSQSNKKQKKFGDTQYAAESWDKQRRVIIKAEHLEKGGNPRFVVTSLAALAYTLLNTIRHQTLIGTELVRARCDTIRLKLLKIGASVI